MTHAVTAFRGARSIAAAAAGASGTTAGATTPSAKAAADAAASLTPGGAMGKEQFLKLLVAQMKNQDPLNPMDGTQMASQLAQFSTVEQLENANDTLAQIAAAVRAAQSAGVANGGAQASTATGA